MATYKATKGLKVQSLASDLTASSTTTGEVWYNTTSNVIKYVAEGGGAWATGGAMNTGRFNQGCSGASNTAALIFAGYNNNPSAVYYALTESYNGTSWTEVADVTRATGRGTVTGFGSQTSAIVAGGNPPATTALTESWSGTSWTEVGDLNNGRDTMASAGTANTSGIAFGGTYGTPPPASFYLKVTETWNGTGWTEVGDLNIGRQQMGAATQGSSTATLCISGELDVPYSPRTASYVESWNGTSWTEIADVNTARTNGSGAGIQTNALYFSGYTPGGVSALTENWNGTSWTEVGDLGTARTAGAGNGVASTAIMTGGNFNTPGGSTATELFDDPSYVIKTVTTS